LKLPGDRVLREPSVSRLYPMPKVRDLDGDGLPDLLLPGESRGGLDPEVLRGTGEGRFAAAHSLESRCLDRENGGTGDRELAFVGDLDGKGAGEMVVRTEIDTGGGDLDQARRPHFMYRFHRLGRGLAIDPVPYEQLEVTGYALGELLSEGAGEPFRDLDGDGRLDLVTVTLDFSVFQVMRVLATKRIGIGLEFHVWSQRPDGHFAEVQGIRLSDKLVLDLNDLRLDRLGNFSGDFDGDGMKEFLAYRGGKTIAMHRGAAGCAYGKKPEMELRLAETPQDARLVKIQDLNGDGKSDLIVTRIQEAVASETTAPVLLDLYLSGEAK